MLHLVKFRIKCIEILGIQMILHHSQCFAESLKMYDFTLSEELDRISYIGVVDKTENIVIGGSCFLFCCTFA